MKPDVRRQGGGQRGRKGGKANAQSARKGSQRRREQDGIGSESDRPERQRDAFQRSFASESVSISDLLEAAFPTDSGKFHKVRCVRMQLMRVFFDHLFYSSKQQYAAALLPLQ
jgi:hypothetical protein